MTQGDVPSALLNRFSCALWCILHANKAFCMMANGISTNDYKLCSNSNGEEGQPSV